MDDTFINTPEEENLENNAPSTFEEVKNKHISVAMDQYVKLKYENWEYLLFYRMGDFYELFFEDAITVSGALGLTLTSRSRFEGKEIPMCGVPFHAYEIYLARLIKMGYKVAICEQTETPEEAKQRGAKAVNRQVVRLVTPGTLTEDTLLSAKRNNYIASFYARTSGIGLAWLDISTGAFCTQLLTIGQIPAPIIISSALARLSPAELIIEDKLLEYPEYYDLFGEYKDCLTVLSKSLFNYESTKNILLNTYNVKTLDAFGDFSKNELIAAGVLLDYVKNTQKGILPRLIIPTHIVDNNLMEIDLATRRSLELLTPSTPGGVSLLNCIDLTLTGIGGRLLAERMASPTTNIREINDRLDIITFFIDNPDVRRYCRMALSKCLDMERAVQRLSFSRRDLKEREKEKDPVLRLGITRGSPRDLFDLAQTLKIIPYLQSAIKNFANYQKDTIYTLLPQALSTLINGFHNHDELEHDISSQLKEKRDDLPALARNGNFIRNGASAALDHLRNIRTDTDAECEKLKQKYSDETGVNAIKIKNNSVIGYFIEVPAKYADKFIENKKFIHRQSVLNAVRFTTEELSELESLVNNSAEKALTLELEIYDNLVEHTIAQAQAITNSAKVIAALDVATSLAELAVENNYTRPVITEDMDFKIIGGRHPVVESVMKKEASGKSFIGNNCTLDHEEDRLWLLTGPNMAGKSTFLRQNALIAILAQMGSYVPAESARIGVIDKLFSRVGASDDLARGRSTFMVEMVETASILNRATERSFVILDEIGRGTATFDGLSIAWAVVEQLYEVNKCRTIFATHYHELTKLNATLKALSLHCMKIKEFEGEVIFLHEVIDGAADRSYGIHVAKLAGLPALTIKRAKQVLNILEDEKNRKNIDAVESELPLFETLRQKEETLPQLNPVIEELKLLDLDNFSPREALDKLYELKAKIK